MAAPLNECPLVLSVSTEQPTVEPGRVYEGDKQAGRGGRGRGKMAWWCLSVSLSPIDNICTFWSFERSGGGGRWRVMTSIVSRRERERGNWTSWSSQLCPPPASSQPASSEPQPPMLGSGAEISSVLCPQGHPSVDHKTVLDS